MQKIFLPLQNFFLLHFNQSLLLKYKKLKLLQLLKYFRKAIDMFVDAFGLSLTMLYLIANHTIPYSKCIELGRKDNNKLIETTLHN